MDRYILHAIPCLQCRALHTPTILTFKGRNDDISKHCGYCQTEGSHMVNIDRLKRGYLWCNTMWKWRRQVMNLEWLKTIAATQKLLTGRYELTVRASEGTTRIPACMLRIHVHDPHNLTPSTNQSGIVRQSDDKRFDSAPWKEGWIWTLLFWRRSP